MILPGQPLRPGLRLYSQATTATLWDLCVTGGERREVHLVCFVFQPNEPTKRDKREKPDRPDEPAPRHTPRDGFFVSPVVLNKSTFMPDPIRFLFLAEQLLRNHDVVGWTGRLMRDCNHGPGCRIHDILMTLQRDLGTVGPNDRGTGRHGNRLPAAQHDRLSGC